MMAFTIMGLLPENMTASGEVLFGSNLLRLPEKELCQIRGNRMGMVFQEPMTALNPVLPIGFQVAESLRLHKSLSLHEAQNQASKVLDRVGLPAKNFSRSLYPHQLSGGQRQRVVIAIAIVCEPELIIADEPTTALDVTIQAQILELLIELQKSHGMALILITHDMAVVAETAEHVVVLYAGQQVEQRSVKELFKSPQHPYSEALLNALPERAQEKLLNAIPGVVPGQMDRPKGCLFNPRCSYAQELCRQQPPELQDGILCHYPLVAPKPDLDVRTQ